MALRGPSAMPVNVGCNEGLGLTDGQYSRKRAERGGLALPGYPRLTRVCRAAP
jgi:hypothetical protein